MPAQKQSTPLKSTSKPPQCHNSNIDRTNSLGLGLSHPQAFDESSDHNAVFESTRQDSDETTKDSMAGYSESMFTADDASILNKETTMIDSIFLPESTVGSPTKSTTDSSTERETTNSILESVNTDGESLSLKVVDSGVSVAPTPTIAQKSEEKGECSAPLKDTKSPLKHVQDICNALAPDLQKMDTLKSRSKSEPCDEESPKNDGVCAPDVSEKCPASSGVESSAMTTKAQTNTTVEMEDLIPENKDDDLEISMEDGGKVEEISMEDDEKGLEISMDDQGLEEGGREKSECYVEEKSEKVTHSDGTTHLSTAPVEMPTSNTKLAEDANQVAKGLSTTVQEAVSCEDVGKMFKVYFKDRS